MFDDSIKFKYPWRPYQERTLKQIESYIRDGKVHIVAAPGSGKTVLGLEIARYINKPVIIFSPTVTIKNQWIDRFISSFTNLTTTPDWISDNIYDLKFFNVATYQALHYAYKKKKLKQENLADETDDIIEDISESQVIDKEIETYDIVKELKSKKISTIILDEAHHLKSQWWDSLKQVISELSGITIISLTATPPYDSEYSEWKKYISLCGEIDAEITVPELVKANNLCPHQDYIYFNFPTEAEQEKINSYNHLLKETIKNILENNDLLEAIKSHKYITSPYQYEEDLLDNIEYYSSMLIYLNYKNQTISKENLSILGNIKNIPVLSNEWLEILLKNIVIKDRKNFENFEHTIKSIETELNKSGIIEKSNLSFSQNYTLQKYFLNSIGKLNSISNIVEIEKNSLQEELRIVILTDFIRKEYKDTSDIEIDKLGVFPIFKKLTKNYPNINMAILTGSIFVIPTNLKENLCNLCSLENIDISKLRFEELPLYPNYSEIKLPTPIRNKVMSQISKLFSNGLINIIIGTKSLLGEGWDEPSINTLVLASFVGSFMLSNQMRGRAIRVNKNPNKTANIWHLVCVTNNTDSISNADFEMLKRRFNSFVGLDYETSSIRSGISRLGNISEPFTKENIENLNNTSKTLAQNREKMYSSWKNSLDLHSSNHNLTNAVNISNNNKIKQTWFVDRTFVIISIILTLIVVLNIINIIKIPTPIIFVLAIFILSKFYKMYKFSKPEKAIKEMGRVVLYSLCRYKFIKTPISSINLKISSKKDTYMSCYITGCTLKESNLFADCLEEVFDKTINQRYIISKLSNNLKNINEYYNVPTILGTNKEYAETFSNYWNQKISPNTLIYTRTAEGRKILLKARMKNLSLKDKIFKNQEFSSFK